jgi:glycosyltransferase involved in cell wall biosynthesis
MTITSQLPFVTLVMPIRNEEAFIAKALEAVINQDYPGGRMEIIVVDGISRDGTREIVAGVQSRNANITLLSNPRGIVPAAMNIAMAKAKGEIIIRVDGHCRIAADYVRRCVDHLTRDGVDGVGGPVRTVGETRVARAIAAAMSSPFGVGGSAFRTTTDRTMLADTVPFPAYTRAIVDRAGPYDEELVRNQDDEYNYRLRKLGAKILLAADVRSEYYSRSSFRSLWRQYFQYGVWKVRVMQKHPRQMRARQFVPVAFVCALGCGAIAAPFSALGGWFLALVAGTYVAANLLATLVTARGALGEIGVFLPLAFAELHLAFGFGFLAGLVKFRSRWRGSSTGRH